MENKNLPENKDLYELLTRFVEDTRAEGFVVPEVCADNECTQEVIRIPEVTAMDELLMMTGMQGVKEAVQRQVCYHKVMKMRRESGRRVPRRLMHMLLTGNPGCGKTTVARLIGRIFREEGLLKEGHLVETNRAGLVGQFIGESENRTTEKLRQAEGGILFIDEIYSLANSEDGRASRDFGVKVLDTLMTELSNPDSNVMVIGAGYPEEIKSFLKSNPGLASRFPIVIHFDDFTQEEKIEIARKHLEKYDFELSADAESKLAGLIRESHSIRNSGNARFVITLLENHVIPNFCMRLCGMAGAMTDGAAGSMNVIEAEDIPAAELVLPLALKRRQSVGFNR